MGLCCTVGLDTWSGKPPVLDLSSTLIDIDPSCYHALYPQYPNASSSCSNCQCSFTLFFRAHACRLCDLNCCEDCSKRRIVLPNTGKVCKHCLFVCVCAYSV